jgi:drug/metabolite transporter (DMT)-like permease
MYTLLLIGMMGLNMSVDFMDRRTVQRGDFYALALWTMIIQFLLILPLIGLVKAMPLKAYLLCAGVGAFSAYSRVLWYRAISAHRQTLSRLSPFLRLSSVISLACAFFLLGEPFTYVKGLGGIAMIAGSLLMTLDNPAESIRKFVEYNKAALLVLLTAIATASIAVNYKYLMNGGTDLLSIYFFLKFFQMLSMMSLHMKGRSLAVSYRRILHLRLLVTGRFLQTVASLIYMTVLSHLELSTVEPIASLSPVMLLAVELTGYVIKRDKATAAAMNWNRRTIIVRLLSLSLVGAGVFLLNRS